jgi:hypothetical protein
LRPAMYPARAAARLAVEEVCFDYVAQEKRTK